MSGRLAAVASKSNGAWQVTLFSYDTDGRIATRYTYTQVNGGASVLTAVNTTISYTRDLRDALTQRALTVGSSTFYQWYDYENRGLFWKLFASTSSTKPGTPDVTDTYRPSGQPQTFQFQGGPLDSIRYTISGQVERIGNPALTTYSFSARYAYGPNGTVDTAEFYSAGSPAAQKRYRYVFGGAGYDALNRLKSADFSSWSGSAWTSTLAYDLAGVNYDADGNITALQRYRETATLIDNLTYTYPGTSNRLTSTTDAVAPTAETWDAETGSFTYDANGNLKTAPAPYSITAVSYDPANLPLTITRSGTATTYRYDVMGQRIAKQVGTGNTEIYILDGATTLGVFTVNSGGSATSWYFNLLAGDQVVGRHPNTGTRSYYYTDMLGSTRSVVQNTTVVESYDFEPWGLLMAGRTLGSGTKEGFGAKEQDIESGLDYFEARYYMAALGRWGSTDPLSGAAPEWSPYNYVLNDPLVLVDPSGMSPCESTTQSHSFNCPGDDSRNSHDLNSPIYDTKGQLLGTDDQGLQGEPIVMDPKDFRQGMAHEDAVRHDLGTGALVDDNARAAFSASVSSLPSRPDYDGVLTYNEAVAWFNRGRGRPLYIDARTLDLSRVTVADVLEAKDGYINLFRFLQPFNNTGSVFGTIKFTLVEASTGSVLLGGKNNFLDKYDFSRLSPFGLWARMHRGAAKDFVIYCTVCTNHVQLDNK